MHPDVIVLTSRVWQTTCTIVRSGDEAFVIDSPVYPDELELLPTLLAQAGFPFTGLLATHGDWDHLLGRLAFPQAALGIAETTAARLRGTPAEAQRELRDFDDQHYVIRPAPLSLGQIEALAVPGFCGIGERELELHPADGHTDDGMAVFAEWAGVLICGDYLSPVEIPIIRGSPTAYLATLGRLGQLVERAEWIVPGHGEPLDRARGASIAREHRDYVEAMIADPRAVKPPLARGRPEQRRLHAANVERFQRAPGS
ncbi:MAG TPA: MBL fold metallo-hydrolase [Solirubrobacteraceae bacterium]|nr:MBL fold metallo-hydrolase [Solirubrobacteraceae bacterium]